MAPPAGDTHGSSTASRRELFALAAVLAATALTGAAAIAGLTRAAPAPAPAPLIGPPIAPAAQHSVEPGD